MSEGLSFAEFVRRRRRRRLFFGSVALAVTVLAFGTAATTYHQRARDEWFGRAPVEALSAEIKRHPNDADLLYATALKLWRLDEGTGEAFDLASRSVQLDPNRAPYRLLLGYLLMPKNRPAEALREMEAATRLDPRLTDAQEAAGQLCLQGGLWEEAQHHFRQAWDPMKPRVPTRLGLITALVERGELEEAEAVCRQSVAFAPPSAVDGFLLLYRILKQKGQQAEVVRMMEEHLVKYHYGLEANYLGQLAILELDSPTPDLQRAEEFSLRAIKKDAASARAQQALALVRIVQQRNKDAVVMLNRALSLKPQSRATRELVQEVSRGNTLSPERRRAAVARFVDLGFPDPVEAEPLRARFRDLWRQMPRDHGDPALIASSNEALAALIRLHEDR